MSHFISTHGAAAAKRVAATVPHAPTAAPLYYIGRNGSGHWVVRDASGRSGGIFVDRAQAIKFAMFENGRHPEAVVMVPGTLELDLK
jgi:hypothetical protein